MSSAHTLPVSRDALLLGYAAGNLTVAETFLAAALLAFDAEARRAVSRYEAMGGHIIENEDPAAVCHSCLEAVLKRIETCGASPSRPPCGFDVPAPLRALIESCAEVEARGWVRRHGIPHLELRPRAGKPAVQSLYFAKLGPGEKVAPHRHGAPEITLVLEGSYADEYGSYRSGDIAVITDGSLVHAPRAGDEGCLCLVMTARESETPVRRFLFRFFGI